MPSGASEVPEKHPKVAPAPTPRPEAVSYTPRGVPEMVAGRAALTGSAQRESSTGLLVGAGEVGFEAFLRPSEITRLRAADVRLPASR